MTTIITRLYADTATASHVADQLRTAGMASDAMDVISGADATAAMRAARMSKVFAAAYAPGAAAGHAVLVVRVPFNPIGAVLRVTEIVDATPSHKVGLARESEYIRERLQDRYWSGIMKDHPRFFSQDIVPGLSRVRGTVSAAFGLRLLSPYTERRSAGSYHILPGTKVITGRTKTSAIRGGGTMSSLVGWRTISTRN